MSKFKDVKKRARARNITEAQRKAQKKERILEGFQCPKSRCMSIMKLAEYRDSDDEHSCTRCGTNISEFTPLFVDHRRITP